MVISKQSPASPSPKSANATFQEGFVDHYLQPTEIFERCQDLAARFPDRVEMVIRDYKTEGYDGKNKELQGEAPLYYLRIGPKTQDRDHKVGVFEFASPHAREWINPMIMTELATQLVTNYDPNSTDPKILANTKLLDQLDIFICPETNPDGTNFTFNDNNMWRKNRSKLDDGNHGVDVNRNYPTWWEPSGGTNSDTYPGKAPMSEPETRHIAAVVEEHPNIRFVCDWHSHAEEIRRPYAVSKEDEPIYNELHKQMAEAIKSVRGREYKTTVSKVANGTSDDYFYQNDKVFSMLVEDGRAFQPKPEEAVAVKKECVEAGRKLLEYAAKYQIKYGLATAHPPATLPNPPCEEVD